MKDPGLDRGLDLTDESQGEEIKGFLTRAI